MKGCAVINLRPKITVSGRVRPSSGIGVIQRFLYPHLELYFELVELRSREASGIGSRIRGLLSGFLSWDRTAVGSVCLTSPLPALSPHPLVTVVHDLRWMGEGSWLKALYRKWDLSRIVKHSDSIICVSNTTYNDLIRLHPEATGKATWAWLGPGILEEGVSYSREGAPGRFILIGADPRKKNELAAEVLAELAKRMPVSVTGINLSQEAKTICESALGDTNCRWLEKPDNPTLIQEFQQAQYYMLLGTGEGFGLPFVESMGTGTVPVTYNYELSREVIGTAGVLLEAGSYREMASQIYRAKTPSRDLLQERYQLFSWSSFANKILTALESPVVRSKGDME